MPDNPPRRLAALVGPAVMQSAMLSATFVLDRQLLRDSPSALAALHLPSTVVWAVSSLTAALAAVVVAATGRGYGAACSDRVSQAAAAATHWARRSVPLAAGFTLGVGAILCRDGADSLLYLGLVLPAAALAGPLVVAASLHHAAGDTTTPMVATGLGGLLHVAGTAVGVQAGHALLGAGLGLSAGMALQFELNRRRLPPLTPLSLFSKRSPDVREPPIFRQAGFGLVERGIATMGYLTFAALIVEMGERQLADHQWLLAVESLAHPVAEGCAVAASTLVARRLGANRPYLARRATLDLALMAVLALAVFGGVIAYRGTWWGLEARLGGATRYLALTLPLIGAVSVAYASLRSAGRFAVVALATGAGMTLRLILVATPPELTLETVWQAAAVDWLAQLLVLLTAAAGFRLAGRAPIALRVTRLS